MVCHYFSLQDIKISFEDVDFYAKLSLILNTPVRNSKTQRHIVPSKYKNLDGNPSRTSPMQKPDL